MTFDPNGGDMGRAALPPVSPLEFSIIVPHIAHILQELHISRLFPLSIRYGFEFYLPAKEGIESNINYLKNSLPPNVSFYKTNGKSSFEIRGASGGISTLAICYLYTHDGVEE